MLRHELTHLGLSLLAGGVFAWKLKLWKMLIPAILIGMFVDVDHLFDYFLYKKRFNFDLTEFFSGDYFEKAGRVFVLFHGYEYALILFAIGLFFWHIRKRIIIGSVFLLLASSLGLHLLFDAYEYRPKWQTYFISYRIYHNFSIDQLEL